MLEHLDREGLHFEKEDSQRDGFRLLRAGEHLEDERTLPITVHHSQGGDYPRGVSSEGRKCALSIIKLDRLSILTF